MRYETARFFGESHSGYGCAVGLKGTDGKAYLEALKLGAEPVTPKRARRFLSHIKNRDEIFIISAPGVMGERLVEESQIQYRVAGSPDSGETTSAEDTKRIVGEMMKENLDILVFVGGDGTSRDIYDVVGSKKPVLGVARARNKFEAKDWNELVESIKEILIEVRRAHLAERKSLSWPVFLLITVIFASVAILAWDGRIEGHYVTTMGGLIVGYMLSFLEISFSPSET